MSTMRFWNNLMLKVERLERQIIEKRFWQEVNQGPKQDSQNHLKSPMPERAEP